MGTVKKYETKAGVRWEVRYYKQDHSEGRIRGLKTKKEATDRLAAVTVSKANHEFIDPISAKAKVDVLGAAWLAGQSHLKPSSLRPLEIAWRLHVQPIWGSRAVGSIRHSEVQEWVTELTGRKGATTVIRAYGVLASLLDDAVLDRRVPANAARSGMNLPRKTGKKRVYLSHDQVELLASNTTDFSTLILFLSYTGLRWGEATALRVSSLNALRRRVQITENAVDVGGKIMVGTPKSHTARSVPYPSFLSVPLAKLCEGKDRDALLFGNGLDYVRLPHSLKSWLVTAVKASQVIDSTFERVTIHDLRHTAASLSISAGANVKAVQRMLGHASAAMTLDTYADLFEDDLDAVGMALDKARTNSSAAKTRPNVDSGK